MKKLSQIIILTIMMLMVLAGCGCDHQWMDATCTSPKTCSVCQKTEGTPLAHQWQDASCIAPKTCTLCSATDGDVLPHTPGDMTTTEDYVRAVSVKSQACTACGEILSTEESPLTLVRDGIFLLNAEDFVARLNRIYASRGMTNRSASLEYFTENGANEYMAVLRYDDIVYGRIYLCTQENDPNTTYVTIPITESQKQERIINQLRLYISYVEITEQIHDLQSSSPKENTHLLMDIYAQSEGLFRDILNPIYHTLSPTLSEEEIESAVQRAYENAENFLTTNIIHQEACGDFYTEYFNFFMVMGAYTISFTTTPDNWVDPSSIS